MLARRIAVGWAVVAACLVGWGIGAAPAVGAEPLATHLDQLVIVAQEAVDQALGQAPAQLAPGEGPVLLVADTPNSANWVVEHVLTERLLARGLPVTTDTTLGNGPRLAYRVLELRLTGQSRLVGSLIDRQARLSLALRLSHGDSLQWQDETAAVRRDRVPRASLELLSNSVYPFTKLELEERSFGRFIEPVIVSTVLGGLIYLFFANR